jgi:hypothetical protein
MRVSRVIGRPPRPRFHRRNSFTKLGNDRNPRSRIRDHTLVPGGTPDTRDGYAPQTSCRNRRSPRGGSFVADVANATLIAHDLLLALQLCLPYPVVAWRPRDAVRAPYGQERNREHWGSQTKTHNAGYSTWHSAKTQKPNSLGRRVLNAAKAVFARNRLHRWRVVPAGAGHRTRDGVLPERRNREPEMFPRSTLRAV